MENASKCRNPLVPQNNLVILSHRAASSVTITPSSSSPSSPDICALREQPGNCHTYMERYYFNVNKKKCSIFIYSGCGGNGNNFESKADCQHVCAHHMDFSESVGIYISLSQIAPCRVCQITLKKKTGPPTNTASVNSVMGCPNARTGVSIVGEKDSYRATKFQPHH